jgi:hypothetical protein
VKVLLKVSCWYCIAACPAASTVYSSLTLSPSGHTASFWTQRVSYGYMRLCFCSCPVTQPPTSHPLPSAHFLLLHTGMAVTAIDTPGLHASADAQSANRSLLRGIKAAWKKHKPNFLIYVDRWVFLGGGSGGGGTPQGGAGACQRRPGRSTSPTS